MITTQNIYKAIKQRLSDDFPDITNTVKDIKNPPKPCLYVEYVESHDREVANNTIETTCSFDIVYYSADNTLLDLTEIEKRLRFSLRKPLKVFTVFYESLLVSDAQGIKIKNFEQLKLNRFAFGKELFRFLDIKDVETSIDEYEYILECSIGFEFLHDVNIGNPYDEYDNFELMNDLYIENKKEV